MPKIALRPFGPAEAANLRAGVEALRKARDSFHAAGCPAAADACRRALKSAQGAERHAQRRPRPT